MEQHRRPVENTCTHIYISMYKYIHACMLRSALITANNVAAIVHLVTTCLSMPVSGAGNGGLTLMEDCRQSVNM